MLTSCKRQLFDFLFPELFIHVLLALLLLQIKTWNGEYFPAEMNSFRNIIYEIKFYKTVHLKSALIILILKSP